MSFEAYIPEIDTSDISYNVHRKTAALTSVTNKITYHLLDCVSFEVLKKAKWQTRHRGKKFFRKSK